MSKSPDIKIIPEDPQYTDYLQLGSFAEEIKRKAAEPIVPQPQLPREATIFDESLNTEHLNSLVRPDALD